MEIDIRTLVVILGVTHLIQVLVFYHQFRVIKVYRGTGWWLMWCIVEVIGFGVMLHRNIPSLLPGVLIIQNTMIIAGTIFLYIGVRRFLDMTLNLKLVIPVVLVFFTGMLCFLFIDNDINIRLAFMNATHAFISCLTAYSLLVNKNRTITASARFNAVVFLIHAGVLVILTTMELSITPHENLFNPTIPNLITFFDALIVSMLWTFGIIIMLNQRLNAEMNEARGDLKLIFNTSPDAAVISRLDDGKIVDFNEGYTSLTGYTPQEISGKSTTELGIWKNDDEFRRIIDILNDHGSCENQEIHLMRKDGMEISGLLSAKKIKLQGVPHIISITRDITERRLMEEKLSESELQFRSLYENMSEGVALLEIIYNSSGLPVDYRIVDVNKAFENLTTISCLQARGALASELYGTGIKPYITEYTDVFTSGKPFSFETYFQPINRNFNISVVFLKPGFFATILLDITRKKQVETETRSQLEFSERSRHNLLSILEDQIQAQEALRESEEKFAVAFKTSPNGITISRPEDGQFVEVNNAFCTLTGFTREETIANESVTGRNLWVDAKDRNRVTKILLGGGKVVGEEYKFIKKNGEIRIGLFSAHLIKIKNQTLILSYINDITGRKQAEAIIRELNTELEQRVIQRTAQLEASNQELEAFSYSVSHDLRAPLRHISGYVDLLTSQFHKILPTKGKHYLDTIANAAHQMGKLIDDLLQFSQTGRKEMQQTKLDMNHLIQGVLKMIKQETTGPEIEWVISSLPLVSGDNSLLSLVWLNLLSNAVKFTRKKEKRRIEIGFREENGEFLFFVRDNGAGFDMRYADKLFGVFQRLHSSAEFEGTGIGLANVRRIIKRHGGRTWADAEIDNGAIFYFTLPKA